MKLRVGLSAAALLAGVGCAALLGIATSSANHIPGATYTGSVSGGGSVTFTVSAGATTVSSFAANSFGGGVGCTSNIGVNNLTITNHQFSRTSPSPSPHLAGNFDSVQGATGTVRAFGVCDTGTLAWSATTSSQPDTTPPDTTITGGPPNTSNDNTPTFHFTSEAGATFLCRIDLDPFLSCTSPYEPGPLPDGGHVFQVKATDTSNNTEDPPEEASFTIDTTPPETFIDGGPPPANALSPVIFNFHASEPASFMCSIDGVPPGSCASPHTVSVAPGGHDFAVFATDPLGNTDSSPAHYAFNVVQSSGSPPPGPGPGPPPPPPPFFPAPVGGMQLGPTSPELGVPGSVFPLRSTLRDGLVINYGCPVGCGVTARLLLARATWRSLASGAASARVVVGRGTEQRILGGRDSLRVRFTRKARRRLRRARRLALTLRVSYGLPGQVVVLTRRLTLRRGFTAPSGPGSTTTPTTTTPGTTTPPSPAPGPSANNPPAFPTPMSNTASTQFQYDPNTGNLTGATTMVTVTTPATDPDGDPISYSWTATNGTVQNNGLSATWQRVISLGQPADGDLTITASDNRGGTDTHTFQFR